MTLSARKQAGVCLHLTSLPGKYGIGEMGAAARAFIDQLTAMDVSVWQFLPTGPTAYGDSPYQSLSAFAGNELLIDTANLIELSLITSQEAECLLDMPADTVAYGRVIPAKNKLLRLAIQRFEESTDTGLKAEFEQFVQASDALWLHDYALYRSLKNHADQRPWVDWEPALAVRDVAALQQFADSHRQELRGVKILQFLFARQWQSLHAYARAKGVTLFGDMPIYIALDSADAWAHPELLQTDELCRPVRVAGVPPDYFSADGQLWGNPLYEWDFHEYTHFAWWVERVRHAAAQVDLLRIDHFRGFESYWSIPVDAATARDGRWEQGPGEHIFAALRSALGDLPLVAEDLGIITAAVDELRDAQGFPGMRVLQFDLVAADFDLAAIPENCLCYTGTHDNDTTAGWFRGSPGDQRTTAEITAQQKIVLERTGGRPETIHFDLLGVAFASNARLAIAPMQDYLGLGSEARMNVPGTTANNWRWRLLPEQLTPALSEAVAALITSHGRQRAG